MTQPQPDPGDALAYRRCRFTALLPRDRLYTRDHYWLKEDSPGLWRVGLTPWAVRMVGDLVEFRCDLGVGEGVQVGRALGSLEGFKAVVELRAVATGTLLQTNPLLQVNLDAITLDCYGTGWLYVIQGTPEAEVSDAAAYRLWLDETIDAMRGSGAADPS